MLSDFRYAVRSLLHARWFSIGAVLTFALGIGVNVAVFSAVDRMLFRPLPYARPDELYMMRLGERGSSQEYGSLPALFLVELRRQHHGIVDASTAGFSEGYTVSQDPIDEPPIRLTVVSYNSLSLFGVRPLLGRDFARDDAVAKRGEVLISYDLWRARFGGAPDVVGRSLWSNRQPSEIVGVLPQNFIAASSFLDPSSDGLALDPDLMESAGPRDRAFTPYVRLKPGVTRAAAVAEANAIYDAVAKQLPPSTRIGGPPLEVRLNPLDQVLFGRFQDYLALVAAAAGLVLLVACGNLSSLLLVRFRSRERIAATQAALGASTSRLLIAAFIEASLLSLCGAVIGLATFSAVSTTLRSVLPPIFSRYAATVAEPRVLLFTFGVAAVSALVVAVVPAWRLSRVDPMSILRHSGRGAHGRRLGGRALVAVEAALSVLLVAGAAATGRSLVTLEHVDLGFVPNGLYRLSVSFPPSQDVAQRFDRFMRTVQVVKSLPGVRDAGGTNDSFLSGSRGWKAFAPTLPGRGARSNVTEAYFETLGTRVLAGRTISAADVVDRAPVAVLNQSGLRLLWPGATPAEVIGRPLPLEEEPRRHIVGIVADTRALHAADPRADLYLPIEPAELGLAEIVVRADAGVVPSVRELRQRLRDQVGEPRSVVLTPAAKSIESGLLDQRFRATLFLSFGAGALALAAIGLYAVGAFEASRRRAEMGIRITLGASARHVRWLILRDALVPVAAGVSAGALISLWAAKFLQAFLYQVDARSPVLLATVAAAFVGVTVAAAWIPARRAARTDPAVVLRME